MATGILVKKSLVISMNEGFDENNKEIKKKYTYTNVYSDAEVNDLFAAAQAISTLSKGTIDGFAAVDTTDLVG